MTIRFFKDIFCEIIFFVVKELIYFAIIHLISNKHSFLWAKKMLFCRFKNFSIIDVLIIENMKINSKYELHGRGKKFSNRQLIFLWKFLSLIHKLPYDSTHFLLFVSNENLYRKIRWGRVKINVE